MNDRERYGDKTPGVKGSPGPSYNPQEDRRARDRSMQTYGPKYTAPERSLYGPKYAGEDGEDDQLVVVSHSTGPVGNAGPAYDLKPNIEQTLRDSAVMRPPAKRKLSISVICVVTVFVLIALWLVVLEFT